MLELFSNKYLEVFSMVYVRPLTLTGGKKLQNLVRRGKDVMKLRRAQIIVALA